MMSIDSVERLPGRLPGVIHRDHEEGWMQGRCVQVLRGVAEVLYRLVVYLFEQLKRSCSKKEVFIEKEKDTLEQRKNEYLFLAKQKLNGTTWVLTGLSTRFREFIAAHPNIESLQFFSRQLGGVELALFEKRQILESNQMNKKQLDDCIFEIFDIADELLEKAENVLEFLDKKNGYDNFNKIIDALNRNIEKQEKIFLDHSTDVALGNLQIIIKQLETEL